MQAEQLKSLQAPLKERYREDPGAALVTLHAHGRLGEGVTCSVETGKALVTAGLHPATGGTGLAACSGDMLLEALVACAGVTLNAVATALSIHLRDATLHAEGDLDFHGTLGLAKEVPVGFQSIRLHITLDSDASEDQIATLLRLTERYCVVYRTLVHPPALSVQSQPDGHVNAVPLQPINEVLDAVYRAESRRVLATLIRLLGDFDLAEEALHDAFAPPWSSGRARACPANPRAWLVSAGRLQGDRRACAAARRFDASLGGSSPSSSRPTRRQRRVGDERIADDRLRLIFTCCHPALPPRRAGGADAARSVRPDDRRDRPRLSDRAADAGPAHRARQGQDPRRRSIPYEVPARAELPERLEPCCRSIYLVFNEGYSASSGDVADARRPVRRGDPAGPAAGGAAAGAGGVGLLALMLLHESRRAARPRPRAS